MTKDQLVSVETAKLVESKEYVHISNHYYAEFTKDVTIMNSKDEEIILYKKGEIKPLDSNTIHAYSSYCNVLCGCYTQTAIQKWLRDVHDLHIVVGHEILMKWFHLITIIAKKDKDYDINWCSKKNDKFLTYEEALEDGLQEALKLI
jgi:hypothetical protein